MSDDSINISGRTWIRTVENISKVGYSDGVINGQNTSFQTSFDMGYCQGLMFGLDLGYKFAMKQQSKIKDVKEIPRDPCNINCQICLDETTISQNLVNLYNSQKEKNDIYLKKLDT
ncbi:uncharacterized protein LOC120632219 [Pararge aegeria]|uniref:Jg10531 protein n=1 Tax=Pararge aegeria aegeria TaxID=348720 RepID=A0A8S4SHV7_9NEOP|nr:uncharacterized protein LOC120632219 [Pararge aegeria]XP_039757957.1 uncharacterized protein LOC120632219 [Pararge aegeria]CAH2258320.1 jg10531 [Pararge aegeria aegeria]